MAENINALKPAIKEPQTEDVNTLRLTQKVPTIAEIMADLGDAERRAKYEDFLKGGKLNKKDRTPLTSASLYLLGMANRTPDPERYLESLNAAYADSQLKFDIHNHPLMARGAVKLDKPNVSEIYDLSFGQNTIPHELEHTAQLKAKTNPNRQKLSFAENSIANQQKNFQFSELFNRERKMPEEQRNAIFTAGNYRDNDREFNANIAAYALRAAARGEDFINTPEGRELFPDRASQMYYYNNILPQVPSMFGLRENAELKPFEPRNPNASYANQLVRNVKNFLR
jgi:hypothetical protein